MGNKSLLNVEEIEIIPNFKIHIPTVGQVLEHEDEYSNIVSLTTSTPYQYMVFLDDLNIDFTTITNYQLFIILLNAYLKDGIDMSIVFGDLDFSTFNIYPNPENGTQVLYSKRYDLCIDELVYSILSDTMLKLNQRERIFKHMGNERAKQEAIKKARRKIQNRLRRHKKEDENSQLEELIVALVNRKDFKYNYDETMNLSIYRFYKSVKQLQQNITFDNTMLGVYTGNIDTSKLTDRNCLSWIAKS